MIEPRIFLCDNAENIIKVLNEKLNDIIQNSGAHKEKQVFRVAQYFYIKIFFYLFYEEILLHQSVIYYGIYINIGHFVQKKRIKI